MVSTKVGDRLGSPCDDSPSFLISFIFNSQYQHPSFVFANIDMIMMFLVMWIIFLMDKVQRYNKGGQLLDFQQQKSHYFNALHPRKTMRIKGEDDRKKYLSLNHHNKLQNETIRSRQLENRRLFKMLSSIQAEKGILGNMQSRAKDIEKANKKLTLFNEFKEKQKRNQMLKRNRQLVHKIGQVKPSIGSFKVWDSQFQNFKKQEKKISRATIHVFRVPKQLEATQRSLHTSGNKNKNRKKKKQMSKQEKKGEISDNLNERQKIRMTKRDIILNSMEKQQNSMKKMEPQPNILTNMGPAKEKKEVEKQQQKQNCDLQIKE